MTEPMTAPETDRVVPQKLLDYLPPDPQADDLYEGFVAWAQAQGLELYPAQDEAVIEIVSGSHVVLATPTGSGKSLVAVAAHFAALAQGKRSFYTAPLKALVSEKFFSLVEIFGSENVGMMTGDSAVNAGAPIICCTAEILANLALRDGGEADVDQVVMDEFHFYSDPQRGWAWQVPLLELARPQFVLMSATLGDVTELSNDLGRRTGREVAHVTSVERPVPLNFSYVVEPLHELLPELVETHRAPVYVVHFTQAAAVEQAQALLSVNLASREERAAIADELGDFRFDRGFGRTLSRLVRQGIGIHHAGMLPRYRRLVERLTQAGLLKVVCGTDTLGVGINVPIRTVVLTSLVKFDGERMRHLTAREFHQIAGRAGRAGYDTMGDVMVLAPEHVIENRKALEKAGDNPKRLRKIVRKKAPTGAVNWTDKTFERLRDSEPEPLSSQFMVNHAMVLNVLGRPGDPVAAMRKLLTDNHETLEAQSRLIRQAIHIYRSLRTAEIIERLPAPDADGRRIRLTTEIPEYFALNQPLSPFALAAMDLLDTESATHALDVISVVESTLDDPRQVLYAQQRAARGEEVAAMKAEGIEYEERMELLEEVTYPQPLAEELEAGFTLYRRTNPWVADYELSPKTVVRDMVERAATFSEYVSLYGIERSEGVLLRYLADAYRALRQSVPIEHHSDELLDIIEWLGEVVRTTDSSLLDEWEELRGVGDVSDAAQVMAEPRLHAAEDKGITANIRAFRVLVRNALFRRVELAAHERWEALGELDGASGWDAARWSAALDPYFDEYEDIGIDGAARSAQFSQITEEDGSWRVRQILADPDEHHDWAITAEIDLKASDAAQEPVVRIVEVGPWQTQ